MFVRVLLLGFMVSLFSQVVMASGNKCQSAMVQKDYNKAYSICILAARADDRVAQYHVAELYESGKSIKKDEQKSVFWYGRAAEQGHVGAKYKLGLAYLTGKGVQQSDKQAWGWFVQADKQGHAYAKKQIAFMCEAKKVTGGRCNSAETRWEASLLYRNGSFGLKKNNTKEFQSALYAARLDHVSAMGQVGFLYDVGRGVKQDFNLAAEWYNKSLLKGNDSVLNNIAVLYDNGYGVSRDTKKAFKFHKLSAEKGNVYGMYDLAWCYHYGSGTEKNLKQAEFWYQKSVTSGSRIAQEGLDNLHKHETTSPKLFGVNLARATQGVMREAIKKAGGLVIQEDNTQFWYDKYDSTKLLKGSDQLTVGYVDESGSLASAEYRFPALLHKGGVKSVKAMLVAKYGEPVKTMGNTQQGELTYLWKVGMIDVSLKRLFPSMTVFLHFSQEMQLMMLQRERSFEKRRQALEQHNTQSNAF